MRAFTAVAQAQGRRVVGLAPSAAAAKVLGEDIGVESDTLAKLLWHHRNGGGAAVRAGDVLLVDEAGMAATKDLDDLMGLAHQVGARVHLVGDPQQLAAVEAGGALRMIAHRTGAVELYELHRFKDQHEAAATLAIRAGDEAAIDYYEDAGRLRAGTRDDLVDQLYQDWRNDQREGRGSLMLAADNATVGELSVRARMERVAAGEVTLEGVQLGDGSTAGVGDVIVTRLNDRRLVVAGDGRRDWVKNGDLWRVDAVDAGGGLRVQNTETGGVVSLPADYARAHVQLGYASTVHRAQGMTVDQCRVLVTPGVTRESWYVAMSRGREANHSYVVTDQPLDPDLDHAPERPSEPREVLAKVLATEGAEVSARDTIAAAFEAADSLESLVPQYEHGLDVLAAQDGHARAVLEEAVGADRVAVWTQQPAWAALARAVEQLDVTEPEQVRRLLATQVAGMDAHPDPARDPAAVLARRLVGQAPARGLEEWVKPDGPAPRAGQGDLGEWLGATRARIRSRVDALTERAIKEQPRWLASTVGAAPAAGRDQAQYRRAVATVAAYRDRYGISHGTRGLGYEPAAGTRQHADYTTAKEVAAAHRAAAVSDLAARARSLREPGPVRHNPDQPPTRKSRLRPGPGIEQDPPDRGIDR